MDKDLETICLKALEKDVDKRYQTAEEFADELQRFREGRPILARPITRRERLWKWCKRNPKVATLSGLAAGLLLCILVGGYASALVINEGRRVAEERRVEADEARVVADEARVVAENRRVVADEARRRQEAAAKLADSSNRQVLYELKKSTAGRPDMNAVRLEVLRGLEESLQEEYRDADDKTSSSPIFIASADRHLGVLHVELGEYEEGIERLLSAEKALKSLAAEGRAGNARASQMHISRALGDAYFGVGDQEKALQRYEELETLVVGHERSEGEHDLIDLPEVLGKLGKVNKSLGNVTRAREYIERSVVLHEQEYNRNPNQYLAIQGYSAALSEISIYHEGAGETDAMFEASLKALGLKRELQKRRDNTALRHNIALDQKRIASQYLQVGKLAEASEMIDEAVDAMTQLTQQSPGNGAFQRLAVSTNYWQGITRARLKQDADSSFERAERFQRGLVEKSSNPMTRGFLLKILARAGKTDEALKMADEFAAGPDKMLNCGFAAVGYALVSEHVDESTKKELIEKAVDYSRRLIRKGYHDFDSLRQTDFDFETLWPVPEYQAMLDEEEARVKKGIPVKTTAKADKPANDS